MGLSNDLQARITVIAIVAAAVAGGVTMAVRYPVHDQNILYACKDSAPADRNWCLLMAGMKESNYSIPEPIVAMFAGAGVGALGSYAYYRRKQ